MALPLRDPIFLRGRHSVLQRSVVITLALAVLALFAGLADKVGSEVVMRLVDALVPVKAPLTVSVGLAAVALATILGIPYASWLHHSPRGVAVRVCWILCVVVVPFGALVLRQDLVDAGNRWLAGLTGGGVLIPLEWLVFYSLMWAGWTSAFYRHSRTWIAAALLSWLSIPLVITSFNLTSYAANLTVSPWPGFSLRLPAQGLLSMRSQFFLVLAMPWGIPFWWPPADRETADPAPMLIEIP